MGDELELQIEEEEALLAIYDGDPAFKQISSTVFQYRVILSFRYEAFSIASVCHQYLKNLFKFHVFNTVWRKW